MNKGVDRDEQAPGRAIARHHVMAGGRTVHYRRCGTGPAVVLLHDSPRSSRLHIGTMTALADAFTVFALDTPGYGNSEPLGADNPTIADFAAALAQTLAALGLERAPLYATHTGAKIALALAARSGTMPLLVLDGLSIPDALASEDFIAAYMRPFVPDARGAYLAAEWSRTRDMLRWFPWFDTAPDKRIAMAAPSPEWMEDYAIDLFAAGPHYADAYAAAMRWNPAQDLLDVRVPTLVAARRDDVLYAYLGRVPVAQNPCLSVERLTEDRAAWLDWLRAALRRGCADAAPFSAPTDAPETTPSAYVTLAHGQLRYHRFGSGGARPLLILSAPTTLQARAWAEAFATQRTVLVPELPGYAESDPLPREACDAGGFADTLAALIAASGAEVVDVLAIGLAAPLAAHLAARHPARVGALVIDGAPPLEPARAAAMAEGLCPPIVFDAHAGTHLHRAWHMLRDSEVQWPWHDTAPAAARHLPPLLDALPLHHALSGLIRSPDRYGDAALAALAAAGPDTWTAVPAPTLVFTHPQDPAHAQASAIAALVGEAQAILRPAALADAAAIAGAFLTDKGA